MTCTMSKPLKVLLDSTYLLPSFGVEVEGFSEEDIVKLKELLDDGAVEMYYSPIVWVEILGKIARELRRKRAGKEVLTQVSLALKSITETGTYRAVLPSSKDVELALRLRLLGHRDNIDNLLYAIAHNNGLVLMSMDKTLRNFIEENKEHGLRSDIIRDHKTLLRGKTQTKH